MKYQPPPKPLLRSGYLLVPTGEPVLVIRPDKSRTKVINCRLEAETADNIIRQAGKPAEYR